MPESVSAAATPSSVRFHEHTLRNGLQVIVEVNPSVHSVAAGFFVRTGSRDETPDVAGVSHFLEHMAFKGNDQYSADDINRIFDEIGANSNASTDQESTIFYAAVLPEYLDTAIELLSVLMQPSLRQDDFDTEKQVILEEIGMYDDMPSFTAYDAVMATFYDRHPLGNSILGTNESITALSSEQMRRYHADRYKAGNMTLAIAGNVHVDAVLPIVERHCINLPTGNCERQFPKFDPNPMQLMLPRESSVQQHIMQMGLAPTGDNNLRYAADLLAVVVGDDSGSRLYWDMVDPGYVESAEIGHHEFDGAGAWMSYLCCMPDDCEANLERMQKVFDQVNAEGITAEELEQAKNKVASRIVLRGERPMGRLSSLGANWVYRGEYKSVTDELDIVRQLKMQDIDKLLQAYPIRMTTTVGVGPKQELQMKVES